MSDRHARLSESVIRDSRLSLRQLRVLAALMLHRRSDANVWPSRAALSEITGYAETRISQITKELVDLGYVVKHGGGKGLKYTVSDVATVTETVTVTKLVTVTESVMVEAPTVTKTVTPTVTESVTRNREENKEDNTYTLSARGATKFERPTWMDQQLLADLIAHKKAVKSGATGRAIAMVCKEAEKAAEKKYVSGPVDAVERMIAKGWKGLTAEWLNPDGNKGGTMQAQQKPTRERLI